MSKGEKEQRDFFEKYTRGEVKNDDMKNGEFLLFFLACNGDPLNKAHYVSF